MTAICPKCEKDVGRLNMTALSGGIPFGPQWNCVAMTCPFCNVILSTAIDPIAIRSDLINALSKR